MPTAELRLCSKDYSFCWAARCFMTLLPGSVAHSTMLKCVPARSAPGIRRFADDAAKGTREMRLIRQPTGQGDLAEWLVSLQHCAFSEFDTPAHEVGMR